jgi:hypothetical protein
MTTRGAIGEAGTGWEIPLSRKAAAGAEVHKRTLLAGLREVRQQILETAASLPASARRRPFLGAWSLRELLAHLEGWDHANARATEDLLHGRLPGFYRYADRDWRSYNATLVRRYGRKDHRSLVASVKRSHRGLLRLLEAVPAEEMWKDRGLRYRGWRVTIGRLMEAERRDEEQHWRQLVEFAESLADTV